MRQPVVAYGLVALLLFPAYRGLVQPFGLLATKPGFGVLPVPSFSLDAVRSESQTQKSPFVRLAGNEKFFLLSFFIVTFLFAAIYKLLPDVHLRWSDVAIGASVTSLLFTMGKQLIALYLGKASFGSTYGAAGSLVIVLVWVYYSAQLFFLGAEFTKVYTKTFGSQFSSKLQPVPPTPDNVIVNPSTDAPATGSNGESKVNLSR